MKRYPTEIAEFIRAHYEGIGTSALVRLINAEFGTDYSYSQIKAFKGNHHLASGAKPGKQDDFYSKVFPKEICEAIYAGCSGVGPSEMAMRLNERYGTAYTADQLKGYYGNHNINSGVTGRFEKGHVPSNKGRKGYCHPASRATQFKKGQIPYDHKPVGSEAFRSDGYWWVKVAEPNKWRQKHLVIWESLHGKRPPNTVVTFLDGDRNNFSADNLRLITRAENAVMARFGYRHKDADLTETGILMAKVKIARAALRKQTERTEKKKCTTEVHSRN